MSSNKNNNSEIDRLPWKHELLQQLTAYTQVAALENYDGRDHPGSIKNTCAAIAQFWKLNHKSTDFPAWVRLAQHVMVIAPTSAAAERVFSQLKRILRNTMGEALDDYVKASLFAVCNGRGSFRYAADEDAGIPEEEEDLPEIVDLANNDNGDSGDEVDDEK
jgi:hAT family C-terminal dimerisation region